MSTNGRNIDWLALTPERAQYLRSQGFAPPGSIEPSEIATAERLRAAETGAATRDRRRVRGAVPTEYDGRKYRSKAQARYAATLDARKAAEEIAGYLEEVWFPLGPDFGTRVDFVVARVAVLDGHYANVVNGMSDLCYLEAHEVKGHETDRFRKIRKLWPKYAWLPLHIIKMGSGYPKVEIVNPASAGR